MESNNKSDSQHREDAIHNPSHLFTTDFQTVQVPNPALCIPVCNDSIVVAILIESEEIAMLGQKEGEVLSGTAINEDFSHTRECALPVQLQCSNLEDSRLCIPVCNHSIVVATWNESEEIAMLGEEEGDVLSGTPMNEDLSHTRNCAQELPVQLHCSNLEDCCSSFSSSKRGSSLQGTVNDHGKEVDASSGSSMAWWVLFSRTISAGLYLFDFLTTILVVKQNYDLDYHPAENSEFSHGRIQGAFPIFLIIVALAHISNAITFKLTLPPEQQPIRSAYFLPLLQLQRLLSGLWATGSCDHSSISNHEIQEAEALYAIMGATIETAPQFCLQFMIFVQVGSMYTYYSSQTCTPSREIWCVVGDNISVKPWRPSTIIQISLISSLLAGAYNGGRAIMYQTILAGCKKNYMHAFIGGLYTFAALLLRCTTIATLVFIGNSNFIIFVNGDSTSTGPLDLRFVAFLIVGFAVPSILFWVFLRPKQIALSRNSSLLYFGARIMQSLIFGYVSLFLGPLHPLVSDARARNKLKEHKFYTCLLLLMSMHISLDVFALIISITSNSVNPCGPVLDKFTYVGHSPPLSATLTCGRFATFVTTGITLSILSMLSFVYLLHNDIKESIF